MQKWLKDKKIKLKLTDYLLILLVIPVVIYAVFYFKRVKTEVYVDLTFERQEWQLTAQPPEYWKVSNIKVGDAVYNSLGHQIATVTDIEKNVWGSGIRTNIELQLKVQAVYDTRTKKYVLDGMPLLIGNTMPIDLGNSKFNSQIRNIYLSPQDRYKNFKKAKATITVKYREIEPWLAESLKNFVVFNSKNEVIAKVLTIDIQPAEIAEPNASGQMIKSTHPFKKDATMTIELPQVLCDGNACFYNNSYSTFSIGSGFWADNGVTQIQNASIMDVQVVDSNW